MYRQLSALLTLFALSFDTAYAGEQQYEPLSASVAALMHRSVTDTASPRFAFDDSVTLEEIEEQSDIHDLLVRQIEDAYKERWAELAQDDRDQIDYAIDDVAKELAGDDLGDDPAAVVREKVEAALDRRLGSHLWSGRDQTYATAMTLGRLADWEETA